MRVWKGQEQGTTVPSGSQEGERQHRGIREGDFTAGVSGAASRSVAVLGMVQLHGPLLLRNFGLAVKRESQAEP